VAGTGLLVLSSRPWGYLTVDGKQVGTSTSAKLRLPPGKHRVMITRQGYLPYSAVVTIGAEQELHWPTVTLEPVDR
jgi:hypothetical protein